MIKQEHLDRDSFYPDPLAKFIAVSLPGCIFRNRERYSERYSYDDFASGPDKFMSNNSKSHRKKDSLGSFAWQQTQYGLNNLLGDHVPAGLLYESILDHNKTSVDNKARAAISSRPSRAVSRCFHRHRSFFVHTSGEHLDELVLREEMLTEPGSNAPQSGFTLPTGNKFPILDVKLFASSSWNSCSHLLVHSKNNELLHSKTVSLDEFLPPEGSRLVNSVTSKGPTKTTKTVSDSSRFSTILEPLQKWRIPETIVSLASGCSSGHYSSPSVSALCDNGVLYTWSLSSGFTRYSETPILDVDSASVRSWSSKLCVDTTSHPCVMNLMYGNSIYQKDLRQRGSALLLKTYSENLNSIATIPVSTEGFHQMCLVRPTVSSGGIHLNADRAVSSMIELYDSRYLSVPIASKSVPDRHERLEFHKILDYLPDKTKCSSDLGILVGSSSNSRKIFTHIIGPDNSSSYNSNSATKSRQQSLFCSSAQFSSSYMNSIGWDTVAFPVLSESSDTLIGTALLPCPDRMMTASRKEYGRSSLPLERNIAPTDGNVNRYDSNEDGIRSRYSEESNSSTTGTSAGIDILYNAVLYQQGSKGDVYMQRLRISIDELDENVITSNRLTYADDQYLGDLPPIQLGAPCGTRCHIRGGEEALISTTSASASAKSKVKTKAKEDTSDGTASINTSIVDAPLPTRGTTIGSCVFSEDKNEGVFPRSSSAFSPYISEGSLKGFEVVNVSLTTFQVGEEGANVYINGSARKFADSAGSGMDSDIDVPGSDISDMKHMVNRTSVAPLFRNGDIQAQAEVVRLLDYDRPALLQYLSPCPRTLWEIWSFFVRRYLINVNTSSLLRGLRAMSDIQEARMDIGVAKPSKSLDNVIMQRTSSTSNGSGSGGDNAANTKFWICDCDAMLQLGGGNSSSSSSSSSGSSSSSSSNSSSSKNNINNSNLSNLRIEPCGNDTCILSHMLVFSTRDSMDIRSMALNNRVSSASSSTLEEGSDISNRMLEALDGKWTL